MGANNSCCLVKDAEGRERIKENIHHNHNDSSRHNSRHNHHSYFASNHSPESLDDIENGPDIISHDSVQISELRGASPSSTVPIIQHISEREGEDTPDDPSNYPSARTLFHLNAKHDLKQMIQYRKSQFFDKSDLESPLLKKCNSCSTIYVDDSTVSQPNLRNTIKAVSMAIYKIIKTRHHQILESGDIHGHRERLLDIFDEKLHPLTRDPVPHDYHMREPEHKMIYRFMRTLFSTAQLTAECAIVTLVYLERLILYAEIDIVPSNWKRILLGAILLASKVWDDQAVWNVDYCQILRDITVEDMNELERQFLEMLQFNINVDQSIYAKYYFDLRNVAELHGLSPPLEPLDHRKALKLEATSRICEDTYKEMRKLSQLKNLSRSHSLDGISKQFSRVIIP